MNSDMPLLERLKAALVSARKQRDDVAVAALRSAIAAIQNAETDGLPARSGTSNEHVAGSVPFGEAEVVTVAFDVEQELAIARSVASARRAQAAEYRELGQTAAADTLLAEADALDAVLSDYPA